MSAGLFDDAQDDPRDGPLSEAAADAPLAERMRPRTPAEFVGQRHLLGPGKVLRELISREPRQSLILWGPPGVGKTTLARLIAAQSELRFVPYSAVLSGIKEIREVMARAEADRRRTKRRTLVFVDEIHRFNKAQQDAFLPWVERGDILLVGATTENPSFEIIGALLSRCRSFLLAPLGPEDVVQLLRRALEEQRGYAGRIQAEDSVLERIAHATDGDARRALTALETAATLAEGEDGCGKIDEALVGEALQRKVLRHDKSGEEHFNLISALHKSIRNSDADATLYWLARAMAAGEDGAYLARRLVRMASEDIGAADPQALVVAVAAAGAFERLGYPEGKLALVQAAVHLARAPKSNALYTGLAQAEADVENSAADPVPLHLRNASTALMREAGYGEGYRYAHDDPAARDEMECLPPGLAGRNYLDPDPDSDSETPANGPESGRRRRS